MKGEEIEKDPSASAYHRPPLIDPTHLKRLNFTTFDVETATKEKNSICQLGVAVVRDGTILGTKSWLIQPPNNQYFWMNTKVHGISWRDTAKSPTFAEAWHEIKPYFDGELVIMHNAVFDSGHLVATLKYYELEQPFAWKGCSLLYAKALLKLPSYSLSFIADHYGLPAMNEHNAEQDALMTANVLLEMAKEFDIQDNADFYKVTRCEFGQMSPDANLEPFFRTQAQKRPSENKSKQFEGIIGTDKLKDKKFVFTGASDVANRAELEELVNLHGGMVKNTITKQIDFLVKDDVLLSNKTKKANEYGITIISSEAFLKMIE